MPLPCLGLFLSHSKRFTVDGGLQPETSADNVGALALESSGGNRCSHIEHTATLAQGVIITVDILRRAATHSGKALERPLGVACSGFGIALI